MTSERYLPDPEDHCILYIQTKETAYLCTPQNQSTITLNSASQVILEKTRLNFFSCWWLYLLTRDSPEHSSVLINDSLRISLVTGSTLSELTSVPALTQVSNSDLDELRRKRLSWRRQFPPPANSQPL